MPPYFRFCQTLEERTTGLLVGPIARLVFFKENQSTHPKSNLRDPVLVNEISYFKIYSGVLQILY